MKRTENKKKKKEKKAFKISPSLHNRGIPLNYIKQLPFGAKIDDARIFVHGHHLLRKVNSFLRAYLEENCLLLGTDNVRAQISEHIFALNEDMCCNLFRSTRSFENWVIFSK